MKLIVGLGNPGKKYEQTRHNVGFWVAEKFAVLSRASAVRARFEGEFAECNIGGEKVAILCPHTYMNASGQSVRKALDFYKLELSDVLIVCDDLNLASGKLRIRARGTAGGQNGLKDIIRHLGSDQFARLKVGIGRPPEGWQVTDYVLGKWNKPELELIEPVTTLAAKAAISFVTDGVDLTMSRYNGEPKKDKPAKPRKPIRSSESAKKADPESKAKTDAAKSDG